MTTLRREIIQKIKTILNEYMATGYSYLGEEIPEELAEKLADAIIELRAFSDKPKIDLAKSDPAWAILKGDPIDTTDSILIHDAKNAFERDMKFGALPWSADKQWTDFEKFVVEQYKKDKLIFAKYRTWQQNEGKFAALSNRKIRERPADFIACFPDFLAHSAMYGKQRGEAEVDDFGAPISY